MKLKPSQKPKKRYVVFELTLVSSSLKSNSSDTKASFTDKDLFSQVERTLDEFFGIWGRTLATPMLLKETLKSNKQTGTKQFIIKIGHKYVDELKVAMARLTSIKTKDKATKVSVKTSSITTSGTIKSAKAKMGSK